MTTNNLAQLEELFFSDVDKWESRELGADEESAERAEISLEMKEALDSLEGEKTKPISIRLPVSLISDLKNIAEVESLGYQTLVKTILQRFVDAEYKKNYNRIVAEKIALEKELQMLHSKNKSEKMA